MRVEIRWVQGIPATAPDPPTEKERLLAHKKRLEEKLQELQRTIGIEGASFAKSSRQLKEAIEVLSGKIAEIVVQEADIAAALEAAAQTSAGAADSKPPAE